MALNIVEKYKLNTEDFKIYFDNSKKTHVAENIETGEKTNIGVLGIFLEMGILRPLNEEDKLVELKQKIAEVEKKIDSLIDKVETIQINQSGLQSFKEDEQEVEKVEVEKEKPKFDIREKIIEKSIKKMRKYDEDVIKDTEEQEDAWEEI
jgi:vacuolar-type H+-ATPase subunit I/STV1